MGKSRKKRGEEQGREGGKEQKEGREKKTQAGCGRLRERETMSGGNLGVCEGWLRSVVKGEEWREANR